MSKKQIILVRHAKAFELTEFRGLDFDRPLTDKWEKSLKIVAKYLRLIGVKPEKIACSPSRRTRQTAIGISEQFPHVKIDYIHELYNGGSAGKRDSDTIHLSLVQKTKKDISTLMIVWHNDDLTQFAQYLTGDWVPSMKKGSIVVLSLSEDMDWKDIKKGSLTFIYYLTPQFLRLEDLV